MGKVLTGEEFWIDFKDILFGDKRIEDARDEVEKIIELGGLQSGNKVLDMPCGVGRHTKVFEEKDFDVVGVEKTKNYAKDARERTDSEIVNKDMKNFRRENKFDAVVNWWNSFGYFENKEDDIQTLKNIQASLREGGVLLMDVVGKEVAAKNGFENHWDKESSALVLQSHEIKEDWEKIENTWIKVENGEQIEYTWHQRLYSAKELRQILEKAGFSKIEFYGNIEQEPYNHEADRMIVKALN